MPKIKVITGGMRSGKSEDIYRRYKRAIRAGVKVQVFKPDKDKRFSEDEVISRDNNRVKCTVVPADNAEYILSLLEPGVELVIIDEAQFFAPKYEEIGFGGQVSSGSSANGWVRLQTHYPIVDVVQELFDRGMDVIVEGLDMDSDRKPFGPMGDLMAIATEIRKLHAICEVCHESAMYSYATFNKQEQIVLGDEEYTAVCPKCRKELQRPGRKLLITKDDEETVCKHIIIASEEE